MFENSSQNVARLGIKNKFFEACVYCTVRQVLSNGSLYVESRMAEEGVYQCRLSVNGVGVLLSRKAHVTIACKFMIHCFINFCIFSVDHLLFCPLILLFGRQEGCVATEMF